MILKFQPRINMPVSNFNKADFKIVILNSNCVTPMFQAPTQPPAKLNHSLCQQNKRNRAAHKLPQ